MRKYRTNLGRVLDLGAGDARFASGGLYEKYEGIEIDPEVSTERYLPTNGKVSVGCAFTHTGLEYDACIGNPPYVRHHDLERPWKTSAAHQIEKELSVLVDQHGNLYLYFLCLALIKSAATGLLALLIPYEWVSRPSAAAIRRHIRRKRWRVAVYRFESAIFPKVLTTASITIIDKADRSGLWKFYDVHSDLRISNRGGAVGGNRRILPHSNRGAIWARRGLSPGSQDIFTLAEGDRIHAGLRLEDVVPCVTTLRHVPQTLRVLNEQSFQKHFVNAGRKCWLIRSRETPLRKRVRVYLDNIPAGLRQTYTCLNQKPWYAYEWMPVPQLLFHSAFKGVGPKVLVNSIGAQAVGSVYGISFPPKVSARKLQSRLLDYDFESRVVAHAQHLKKLEVKQLNAVLKRVTARYTPNGKAAG